MVFVNNILILKNCLQGNICLFFFLHIAFILVVSGWFYDTALPIKSKF